jgi:tetratricopeptide (TPR) repeat protein
LLHFGIDVKHNKFKFIVILLLSALLLPHDADAIDVKNNIKICVSHKSPVQRVAACTRLIRSGSFDRRNLSLLYNYRAAGYRKMRSFGAALQDYSRALSIRPRDAATYNNRGIAYFQSGRIAQAIADYTRAIKLSSKGNGNYYYNRGRALARLSRFVDAVKDYTEAIRFNPQDAAAFYHRALALGELRLYLRAIGDYSSAIGLQPNRAPLYARRGYLYLAINRRAEAHRDLRQALKLAPASLEYRNAIRNLEKRRNQ